MTIYSRFSGRRSTATRPVRHDGTRAAQAIRAAAGPGFQAGTTETLIRLAAQY